MSKKNNKRSNSSKIDKNENLGIFPKLTSGLNPFIIIALICVIIYIKAPGFEFSGFDDGLLISMNVDYLKDMGNISDAFKKDAFIKDLNSPFYRPLQTVSFIVDTNIGEAKPAVYHITNVLIHICISLLLFVMFCKFKFNKITALFGAMLFALNPLLVHTVSWIPARGDLLLNLFGIISVIFWLNYIKSDKFQDLVLSGAGLLLSAFSKEVGLILPVIFVLIYYFEFKKIDFSKLVFPALIWIGVIAIYFMMRNEAITYQTKSNVYSLDILIQNIPTLFEFISKFITGFNLSPVSSFTAISTISGAIFTILIILFAFKEKKINSPYFIIGFTWLILFLIPTMMFKHAMSDYSYNYLEHRAYLPLIGLIIMILGFINDKLELKTSKNLIIILSGILIIFSVVSLIHTEVYRNPFNFYDAAISRNPGSALSYYNRGVAYRNIGNQNAAFSDYNKALEIFPGYADARYDRGNYYQNQQKYDLALKDLNEAVRIKPDYYQVYNNLAIVYGTLGNYKKTIEILTKALSFNPNFAEAYNNRGFAYALSKKPIEAMEDFNKAISLKPNFPDALQNRGNLKFETGDKNGACEDWSIASKLGSKAAQKFFNLKCK
jgi:tetratricopeptide (TPR) repeat protein